MRSRKCRKHQISGIWLTVVYLHSCQAFISLTDLFHIREIKSRIYTLGIHIHAKCNNVNVTGTFSVSEQCTFDTVGTCKDTKLRCRHTASSVVVRMQGKYNILSVFQMLMYIL